MSLEAEERGALEPPLDHARLRIVQATWVRYHHFDLARELNRQGHLARLFTSLPPWKVNQECREQGIERSRVRCNPVLHAMRRLVWKLPGHSARLDVRLAVAETRFYSRWVAANLPGCDVFMGISGTGLRAGRLAKSRGATYVMDRGSTQIRHADVVLGEEHRRWGVPWRPIDPWLIENEEKEADEADLITVPSDHVRDTFIQTGTDASKIRVVPYGVSLQEFHPVAAPRTGGCDMLFVGQFGLRKGAPYLLQAFKKLAVPGKRLTVVGHVSPEMVDVAAAIGTDGVEFVGPVPRSRVKEYMSRATALVLPSIEEGLALVQGQALACGCPVIATPNTGAGNLFGHGVQGLLVPARDVDALARAMEEVASNLELRARMSSAALARAASIGGWSSYANDIVRVFRQARIAGSAAN